MNNEIEYIEPTQEHVGQMVEVSDGGGIWCTKELLGIVNAKQKFITDATGTTIGWERARIPRPLTYAERQAKCGLKVGDRVRFVKMREQGSCRLTAFARIGEWVGQCGTVTHISDDGILVRFADRLWEIPYFVLEKVGDRKAIHDDYGKIVYVDGCPQDEFKLVTTFCEVISEPHSCTWFGVVRSGDKRFVYELSNLRVKE